MQQQTTCRQLFYRMRDLTEMMGLSRYTILRMIDAGSFPQPVKLAKRAVGWPVVEVSEWMQQRHQEREVQG